MTDIRGEEGAGEEHKGFRLFKKTTTLQQDILICVGITFACSMFGFDSYINNSIMLPVRLLATALMIFNWLRAASSSGRHRRGGFVLFTGIYWLVPTAAAFFMGAGNSDSTAAQMTAEIANILVFYPFSFFSRAFNVNEWIFCAAMLCIVTAAYIISERRSPVTDEENSE